MDIRSPSTAAGSLDKENSMIVTTLKDSDRYLGLSTNLDKAFAWLKSGVYASLPEGRHEIDGDKVFALVQKYETKLYEACRFEAHRTYIDIQMAIEGSEDVEVTTPDGFEILVPYKPDIEYLKLTKERKVHRVLLQPGLALVFFPEDVHKPCISPAGTPVPMRKVVVKVAI